MEDDQRARLAGQRHGTVRARPGRGVQRLDAQALTLAHEALAQRPAMATRLHPQAAVVERRVFERFSRGPELAALAADLGLAEPLLWQSMLIFKQPAIGGEVRWHQDATFFVTEPVSVTTFWFALEDAALDNGCLWVEPGGHRGPLRERFVHADGRLQMQPLASTPWPRMEQAVPLPVQAGTLVVLHGLLPHYSAPNRSGVSRLAYSLHVTDGRARYSELNWLQRDAAMPIRGFD